MDNFKVHPHEKVIKQWLAGQKIQWRSGGDGCWQDLGDNAQITWFPSLEFRVKLEPPKIILKYIRTQCRLSYSNKKLAAPLLEFVPCEKDNANLVLQYNHEGHLQSCALV